MKKQPVDNRSSFRRAFEDFFKRFKRSLPDNLNDLSFDDIKKNLPENVTLPPELMNLPIDEGVKYLKEKCLRESGDEAAFDNAKVNENFAFDLRKIHENSIIDFQEADQDRTL
jgi:hypothetical protein